MTLRVPAVGIAGAKAPVVKRRWHALQLSANEDRFTVSFDGTPLFDAHDSGLVREGQIALRTEEANVTRFDEIFIAPLGLNEGH